jgi:hypothetical protein
LPFAAQFNKSTGWIRLTLTEDDTITVFATEAQMRALAADLVRTADEWRAARAAKAKDGAARLAADSAGLEAHDAARAAEHAGGAAS